MDFFKSGKPGIGNQYLISISFIAMSSLVCWFFTDLVGYRVVALILMLVVSILAMLFDIFPVLLTALLSALIWNFFFIPPTLTLHVGSPEDGLLFLMYFVIASINAVLTFKIRQFERKIRDEKEREKSIQLYNTLLNSLSHELRTPIATIIGAIDTIKESGFKLSEVNRDELHTEIEIASFRLNRQVENLLNMSRLEAGVLQPKPDWCDMNELIFAVIENHEKEAVNHKIQFLADEQLPLFRLDLGLTEQILHNLVHNALQHTPKGSTIRIEVRKFQNQCELCVSDNGAGFPEEEMGNVFDKFYRLGKTAPGGTGLGLSIVKGFTEAMRGTILLQNDPEGGAVFAITIPAETASLNEFRNE